MARVCDFLDFLADNPDKERDYENDPDGVMKDFGLDQDQRHLVRTGSAKELRQRIREELADDGAVRVFMIKMR